MKEVPLSPQKRPLEDRIAIVTGAARGLGTALARRLAQEGCHLVLADIDLEGAEKLATEIESTCARRVLALAVDVTQEAQVREMVDRTMAQFGRIDILVSNVGIVEVHEITEFPTQVWRKIIEINLTGYFLCAREVAKVMKEQRRGVIIQINSKAGRQGSLWSGAYSASKFGGIGLTQSMALDLAPYGIRVNAVCPGSLLDSPLWEEYLYDECAKKWGLSREEVRKKYTTEVPLGRVCTYEDVANVVVFLASDQASYMTGQAINVTGGLQMG